MEEIIPKLHLLLTQPMLSYIPETSNHLQNNKFCFVLFGNMVYRIPSINLQVPGITCPGITCCPDVALYAIFRLLFLHILFERAVLPKNDQMLIHCDVWTWTQISDWHSTHLSQMPLPGCLVDNNLVLYHSYRSKLSVTTWSEVVA